jgi:hypothetical protein
VRYKCTLSVAKTLLTLTAEHGAFAEYEILVNWKNCPYSVRRSIRYVNGMIGDRSKLGESCDYVVPGLSHPQDAAACTEEESPQFVCNTSLALGPWCSVSTLSEPSTLVVSLTSGHQAELLASSTFLPHESIGCCGSDDAVFLGAAAR